MTSPTNDQLNNENTKLLRGEFPDVFTNLKVQLSSSRNNKTIISYGHF